MADHSTYPEVHEQLRLPTVLLQIVQCKLRIVSYSSCELEKLQNNRGNGVETEPACGVIAAILNAVEVDVICITFIHVLTSAIRQHNNWLCTFANSALTQNLVSSREQNA